MAEGRPASLTRARAPLIRFLAAHYDARYGRLSTEAQADTLLDIAQTLGASGGEGQRLQIYHRMGATPAAAKAGRRFFLQER